MGTGEWQLVIAAGIEKGRTIRAVGSAVCVVFFFLGIMYAIL